MPSRLRKRARARAQRIARRKDDHTQTGGRAIPSKSTGRLACTCRAKHRTEESDNLYTAKKDQPNVRHAPIAYIDILCRRTRGAARVISKNHYCYQLQITGLGRFRRTVARTLTRRPRYYVDTASVPPPPEFCSLERSSPGNTKTSLAQDRQAFLLSVRIILRSAFLKLNTCSRVVISAVNTVHQLY